MVPLNLPEQPRKAALCLEPCDMSVDDTVKNALRDAADRLQDAGYQIEEVAVPDMREPTQMQLILWLAEFRRGAAAAVDAEGDPDSQFVYEQLQRHCPAPDLNMVLDCLQRRVTLGRQWNEFFDQYPLILCPISGEPPFPNNLDVESPEAFDRVAEAQVPQIGPPFLGLPGMCVTTGVSDDSVPMGVQLIASRFREDTLLAAAREIEKRGPELPVIDPNE